MLSFIIFFVLSILCAIATVILAFVALIKKENKIFSGLGTMFAAILTLIMGLNVNVPSPEIYPLDNETRTYFDNAEIYIKSGGFDIYYSLDGSDPQDGEKYEYPIIITSSSTVSARSKFWFWWSNISKSPFRFENLSNSVNISHTDNTNLMPTTEPTQIPTETPLVKPTPVPTEIPSPKPTISPTIEPTQTPATTPVPTSTPIPTVTPIYISEGHNPSEGANLMTYVNQYRADAGVTTLEWNSELEQTAQNLASMFATGTSVIVDDTCHIIGRQCNGAKNAQKAVSDWITGNAYIPSESAHLLNAGYTQMGGALYYLPNGNEYGYHYFWVICLQ